MAVLRKLAVAVGIILSFTGLTTAFVTLYKLSGDQSFWAEWLPIWLQAAFVIAPLGLLIMAAMNKAVDAIWPNISEFGRKTVQSVTMPLIMGALMAGVATVQLHGWTGGFWAFWASALLAVLPVAFVVGGLMTFVIKPRLDAVMAR
ncbi:MAG: hypothetical protein AAGD12_05205 [Pseudomonadota bacterium]